MEHDYDLTPQQAADYVGVHVETLKRWARSNKVKHWRTPGGWLKFRRADLVDLLPAEPKQERAS